MIKNKKQYQYLIESANKAIEILSYDDPDNIKFNTDEWVVDKIIDIISDEEMIKKFEVASSLASTDLNIKDVKNGSILWVTALLRPRNASSAFPIGEMGCLRVKVLDIFYGLSKLNNVARQGKLLQ